MAVLGATYNPSLGNNNWDYAYEVWKNINYDNNSIKISPEQLEDFNSRWEAQFKNWELKYQEEDQVEYDLGDEELDINSLSELDEPVKTKGTEETKETDVTEEETPDVNKTSKTIADDNRGSKKMQVASGITAGLGAANMVASAVTGGIAIANFLKVGAVSRVTALNTGVLGRALCFVGCSLTLATGILYHATKPNKDAHQALMVLKQMMEAGNADIVVQQLLMEQTQESISNTATNTETEFADASEKQEAEKSELEQKEDELAAKTELLLMSTIVQESIRTRVENGEKLSDADRNQFKAAGTAIKGLTSEVAALQVEIQGIRDTLTEEQALFLEKKEEAASEMDSKQATYSDQVATFNSMMEVADVAAQFDEATRDLCKSEIAIQALNVASGTLSMLQAGKYGLFGLPFVAMALSGVAMSAVGISEQNSFKNDIEDGIATRKALQENLTTSLNFFSDAVNQYTTDKATVSNLNLGTLEESELPQEGLDTTSSPQELPKTAPAISTEAVPIADEPLIADNKEDPKKNPFA